MMGGLTGTWVPIATAGSTAAPPAPCAIAIHTGMGVLGAADKKYIWSIVVM